MTRRRVEVGKIRREQVINAAVAVITEKGLQHLSLSAVEKKARMSRGQLTYYFPAKEEILLAVFDRLLEMLHERVQSGTEGICEIPGGPGGWERIRMFLTVMLSKPPDFPEFHALQYTFLSQIGHRQDFRERLASLYEEWRSHMSVDFASAQTTSLKAKPASPRTLASFVQALLHGLAMQRVADPNAYDRKEMMDLCLGVFDHLGNRAAPSHNGKSAKPGRNGKTKKLNEAIHG
jgi:AcrR family transcriptional regulator